MNFPNAVPKASPPDPWQSQAARIVAITPETPGVRTYELALQDIAIRDAFRFAAGQFNMLYLPGIGEAAISISSDPMVPTKLAHTVRAVGNVTDALARLTIGDQVFVRGPFGSPWPLDQLAGRDVVVVAGGLGLASQRAAIRQFARRRDGSRVTLLHGAKRPDGLLYTGEYDSWQADGIDVRTIVDEAGPSWTGRIGLVTSLITEAIGDPARTAVFCCGPDRMMVAVAEAAIAAGVAPRDVWLSLERNMACAVAHCGLCQFGPLFVCRDGPVLRYDRIANLMAVPQV